MCCSLQNMRGVFAEYISAPWKSVVPIPEGISLLDASAIYTQGLTALTFVTEAYNVRTNDRVLIHTVAGGLGLHLLRLCKHLGAKVIGTTSTPEKAELARKNGADEVILYKQENTVERVLTWTNGEGVEAIFDGVGKDTYVKPPVANLRGLLLILCAISFDDDFKMIKRKGTIITLGNASGAVPPFAPLKLVEKNVTLLRPTYVFSYHYLILLLMIATHS